VPTFTYLGILETCIDILTGAKNELFRFWYV